MPNIDALKYGYDAGGLTSYLEDIKTKSLQNAKTAVENTKGIKGVCEAEWEGHARENFVTNLDNDAKHVSQQFQTLYEILEAEVNAAQAAMANKDEELIKEG